VNGAKREPAPGQVLVNVSDPKGQDGALAPSPLKPPNALAKLRQNDIAPGINHALPQGSLLFDVPIMFSPQP
jgi:hypothetical protein